MPSIKQALLKQANHVSALQIVFYGVIALLLILLFVSGANEESSLLNKALWDTGHLYLFSALAIAALNSHFFVSKPVAIRLAWLFVSSLLLGVGIEFAQLFVGRFFEISDVFFDLLGTAFGALVFYIYKSQRRLVSAIKALPALLIIIFIVFQPVFMAYQDQRAMYADFPVLADFETEYELKRWDEGNVQMLRSSKHAVHGQSSLVINFLPSRYAGFSVIKMVEDWRGYSQLRFNIFNDQNEVIKIHLKINDRHGRKYYDRFNTAFDLKPGWNDIAVSLADVRKAPKRRAMDMRHITKIGLFLDDPKKSKLMHLDFLRLVK